MPPENSHYAISELLVKYCAGEEREQKVVELKTPDWRTPVRSAPDRKTAGSDSCGARQPSPGC